jgi:hypothetical protein
MLTAYWPGPAELVGSATACAPEADIAMPASAMM